jgi:hypothetical protein
VFCLLLAVPTGAEGEETTDADGTPQLSFTTHDVVNSISVGLVNGAITMAKGQQQLQLSIRWDLLPQPADPLEVLTWSTRGRDTSTVRIEDVAGASNMPLGSLLEPQDREALERDLVLRPEGVTEKDFNTDRTNRANTVRLAPVLPIRPSYLRRSEMEANWVEWLLNQTNGADCYVEVREKPPGDLGRGALLFPREEGLTFPVTWAITQHRQQLGPGDDFLVCRYQIAAHVNVDPGNHNRIFFPRDTTGPVEIHVRFQWRPHANGMPPLVFAIAAKIVSANPSSSADAATVEERNEPDDHFSAVIKYATGASLGSMIATGMRKAYPNAEVVTGALIDDEGVEALVGMNVPVRALGADAGLTIGAIPADDSDLYVGPYRRLGVFTLGAGVKFGEHTPAGATPGDPSLTGRIAGMFAVDLSRIFGGEEKTTRLTADTTTLGGWALADEFWPARPNTGMVRLMFDGPAEKWLQDNGCNCTVTLTSEQGREVELSYRNRSMHWKDVEVGTYSVRVESADNALSLASDAPVTVVPDGLITIKITKKDG